MVPCDIGWNDIGSWNAVSELTPVDEDGNRFEGEVLAHGASNNYVNSEGRLTALVGVQDLLVIDTPDAVLVAHKDHAQDVKHIVGQLKAKSHTAHLLHQTVHRPWGIHHAGKRRPLQDQAHRGQAGRVAVAADAPSPQ